MKNLHRLTLFTLVIVSIVLAACGAQPTRQAPVGNNVEPTLVPTAVPSARTTYTVSRGEVVYDVTLSGRVSPVIEESLSFPIDGVVEEVLEVSTNVRESQLEELSETTHEVLALFRTIIADNGITMILATHDNLVDEYVDPVLQLGDGQILD